MSDVRIQDDLYHYVNGEWIDQAEIPGDMPTTGGFATLAEGVEKTLMEDFKQFAAGTKTTDVTAMADAVRLYTKILDEEKRNADGIKPALPLLEKIASIDSIEKLNSLAKELLMAGVALPVSVNVQADMNDATKNSFNVLGPDMILPDTTFYADDHQAGKQLLAVYADMAAKALAFTPLTQQQQKQFLEDTLAFDKLVSTKVKSQLEWADYVKDYNPFDLEEVAACVAPFDIKGLLAGLYGEEIPSTLIVNDPRAIKEMNGYFSEDKLQLYVHWAYVNALLNSCACLSTELVSISTMFQKALTGVSADPTLEKQAYRVTNQMFAEAIGVYYGRVYFGEEAKADIISLVKKIIETWKGRVARSTFLQQPTKDKAILKLSTMKIKMGYPDDVKPIFSKLTVAETDSYFDAMSKLSAVKIAESFAKLNKPVDPTEWRMPGNMVNACYDPSRNDITFPAAILQKPFYSINQTISENLGGIGAVISHEISHAFDNNGSHFNEYGNLENWWTEKDLENFKALTKDMIEQWDGIDFYGGKVNGELVVSENIADNGGIAVSLEIMHTLENPNFEAYFKNWAKVWCVKERPQYTQLKLVRDVHSPNELRANIQVRNFKEWYDTFGVTENDQMFIPEDKRIIIW